MFKGQKNPLEFIHFWPIFFISLTQTQAMRSILQLICKFILEVEIIIIKDNSIKQKQKESMIFYLVLGSQHLTIYLSDL